MAYEAESTLSAVLDRIPDEVFQDFDCEVLVVDDASTDATFRLGNVYRDRHPHLPIRVLTNGRNQGYGGNQKVGYAYAERQGFDLVVLLHGDGQYAPEALPSLLQPFDDSEVAAVFGSRMLDRGGARDGGMPLYKLVGNRILTTVQNALLRTRMSEFHSGYRVYRVDALRQLHYRLNTDDFHFDTEIILQLLGAGMRIVERPIPTYYGDEISRVNGMAYAGNVLKVTTQFAVHRLGLRQQRRFDPATPGNEHYDVKLGYASSHQLAVDAVPPGASVIDLGAGPGGIAAVLAERGCDVTVLDRYPPTEEVEGVEVLVADLDEPLEVDLRPYTHILLLDVIEHLKEPEAFLDGLRAQMDYEPREVILTTPNIAFVVQRMTLALGQFNYGRSGILDRTHTRLFTYRSLRHLLRDAGFEVLEVRGIPAPFPKAIGDNVVSRLLLAVNQALIRVLPKMFSFQIFVRARPTPDLDFRLADALSSEVEAR